MPQLHFISTNPFYKDVLEYIYKLDNSINDFFYPQDYFTNWNKIYGKNGFFQVQFLVKEKDFTKVLNKISLFFTNEKVFSTFIIIKKFNERGKYLNFYGKGFSISMDIPITSKFLKTKIFLNNIFRDYKVKINFAKDSICDMKIVEKNNEYIKFKKNIKKINRYKKLNSLFSKRLDI